MEDILDLLLKNPTIASTLISHNIEKYKPLAYGIGKEILKICNDYANNDEYFDMIAKAKQNQFRAYMRAGFSKTEAITFMLSDSAQIHKLGASISKSLSQTKKK